MLRRHQHLPISRRPEAAAFAGPTDGPAGRGGFTLVEMMVAVMILAVGLLGLASTAAYVVRQVLGGAQQTIAANVVQSRIEWLRSQPCDAIKDSQTVTRGVTERWVRGTTSNMVLSVIDTVRYSVAGSPKTMAYGNQKMLTYTIMVPCW